MNEEVTTVAGNGDDMGEREGEDGPALEIELNYVINCMQCDSKGNVMFSTYDGTIRKLD